MSLRSVKSELWSIWLSNPCSIKGGKRCTAVYSERHLIVLNSAGLQQDKYPKHTTASVIKNYQWQKDRGVLQQMVWFPQSPDLINTESVWDYMKKPKALRQPRSSGELRCWKNLLVKKCSHHVLTLDLLFLCHMCHAELFQNYLILYVLFLLLLIIAV